MTHIKRTVSGCVLAVLIAAPSVATAQEAIGEPSGEGASLRQSLLGAWERDRSGDARAATGRFTSMKVWGLSHWFVTTANAETGEVMMHHGGTYTLDGAKYKETVLFATERTQSLIGKKFRYEIEVEGDKYKQVGVNNPYNENWKRLKATSSNDESASEAAASDE